MLAIVKAPRIRDLLDRDPGMDEGGNAMDRVMEQSEFLKDVCKLVVYATELGYAVTGDAIAPSHQAPSERASARRASGAACAIDLHFFRRDRGAFTPAEEPCLKPLVEFWESLSPHNRCADRASVGRPRFERG
jgi:hypothetical protein